MHTLLIIFTAVMLSCSNTPEKNAQGESNAGVLPLAMMQDENLKKAYFASGCFWCVEAVFESVKGVEEAVSGYAGGEEPNPTYREVSAGRTGHAEAVMVIYDPGVIDFATLVTVYYGSHNPTTVNGQHPDYGTQYRSVIFFTNEEEKAIAHQAKADLGASGSYDQPIATEILPLQKFWPAEDYHQNFERRNPNQPYVRSVSIPRLNRFKARFPELLKEQRSSAE